MTKNKNYTTNAALPKKKRSRRITGIQCPDCGEASVVTVWTPHRFRYGTGAEAIEIAVTLPVRHCKVCGFEFVDKEGEEKQHDAVCKRLGFLTPAEIRQLRSDLGLSRAELARLTGLGEATISRWERGSLIQNAANDRYLKLLAHKENVTRLRGYAGVKHGGAA